MTLSPLNRKTHLSMLSLSTRGALERERGGGRCIYKHTHTCTNTYITQTNTHKQNAHKQTYKHTNTHRKDSRQSGPEQAPPCSSGSPVHTAQECALFGVGVEGCHYLQRPARAGVHGQVLALREQRGGRQVWPRPPLSVRHELEE